MPLIRPFASLRPAPGRAADVAAPPYDVLSTEEARERAAGRPWSFLHISRPEIDLPPGTDPYDPRVYGQGAESFSRMQDEGVLVRDDSAHYYVYRLVMGPHTQTGLVAVASVSDYDNGRIRKHEYTRPDKEDDRVRQIDALNAQTGPVFLTYRQSGVVDGLVTQVMGSDPEVDIVAEDGVRHTLWVLRDAERMALLTRAFDATDCLYIADGHHRSAAASRVAAMRRKADHTGEESSEYFLAVIFPDNQMQILAYNRLVRDLTQLSPDAFLDRVAERFDVAASAEPVAPSGPGEFGLYLPGRWYRLRIHPARVPQHDPVARLDVSLLAADLLEPLLGIRDPRRDKRIDFVGGVRGLEELQRRVDSGEMALAFSLFPTRMQDLMAVADAREIMPPKSTWFEPKLADGLVSHVLD
jgi:uncharacterized protein (DUF1015 family)